MSQVFFVVQQRLVEIFFPPYIFNAHMASHLWFLAMIESRNSKYHKRRLGFFTFFSWPSQKLEVLKRVRVFPTTQFSVPPAKIGVWSSFLRKLRLTQTHLLGRAQPPWTWQATLRSALFRQPLGALSARICPAFSDTRPHSVSSTALLLLLIAAQSMGRLFRSTAQMLRLRWSLRQRAEREN